MGYEAKGTKAAPLCSCIAFLTQGNRQGTTTHLNLLRLAAARGRATRHPPTLRTSFLCTNRTHKPLGTFHDVSLCLGYIILSNGTPQGGRKSSGEGREGRVMLPWRKRYIIKLAENPHSIFLHSTGNSHRGLINLFYYPLYIFSIPSALRLPFLSRGKQRSKA